MLKAYLSNRNIALITGCGDSLGSGHFQRMVTLLWYLNQRDDVTAFLVINELPDFFPPELLRYAKTKIDFKPDLIIRDIRNSSVDEIRRLKAISKVMVLDDNGAGRGVADYRIDLLPNSGINVSKSSRSPDDIFIYGYNFLKSIIKIKDRIIDKTIDFSVYPGFNANEEYIDFLASLLPEKSNFAILTGTDLYLQNGRERQHFSPESYGEVFLSSKVIISHFGIMLYEGFISGCRLVSINPSNYHDRLTEIAKSDLNILNLGEYIKLNRGTAAQTIEKILNEPQCESISAKDVFSKVCHNLEKFCEYLFSAI